MINQKRIFKQSEIDKWNEKFQSYIIDITKDNYGSYNGILVRSKWDYDLVQRPAPYNEDPKKKIFEEFSKQTFNYRFSFSVSKSRYSEFFSIVSSFVNAGFIVGYESYMESKAKNLKEEIYKFSELTHKVLNTEMVKIQYDFTTDPIMTMMIISIIEDAITVFQKVWGYSEKGDEVSLLTFPIGSIVSLKSDKGNDFIVNNLHYWRPDAIPTYSNSNNIHINLSVIPSDYEILYELIKIEGNPNSNVVKYGDTHIVREIDICPSRTNNLNIILN